MNQGRLLLDGAIGYAVGAVRDVTPALMSRPTPCRGWNLDVLLRHAYESLNTIHEGIRTGQIGPMPVPPPLDEATDLARAFGERARTLLAARTFPNDRRHSVEVVDLQVPTVLVQCAGALEITIHGWDISQACGRCRPIPDALAIGLLAVAPLLIPDTDRYPLFGPPVRPAARANLGDRLVAFLGRQPRTTGSSDDQAAVPAVPSD
jgi:uncharacterized protein (TIGR03086 family)